MIVNVFRRKVCERRSTSTTIASTVSRKKNSRSQNNRASSTRLYSLSQEECLYRQVCFRLTLFSILVVCYVLCQKVLVSTVESALAVVTAATAIQEAAGNDERIILSSVSRTQTQNSSRSSNSNHHKSSSSINNNNTDSQKKQETEFIHHFSACLYVPTRTDDALFALLNEWIAYHYFTLGLRYLVVYFDDHHNHQATTAAQTQFILDRWRRVLSSVTETVSSDTDTPDTQSKTKLSLHNMHNMIIHHWNHRSAGGEMLHEKSEKQRRVNFYKQCANYLHQEQTNSGWTLFLSINEFLTINSAVYNQHHHKFPYLDNNATTIMRQPGGLLRLFLQFTGQYTHDQQHQQDVDTDSAAERIIIQTTNETVSSLSTADATADTDTTIAGWYHFFQNTPCVTIARSLMIQGTDDHHHADTADTGVTTTTTTISNNNSLSSFPMHPLLFVTMSHQRIANVKERSRPTGKFLSKSILDVTRLTSNEYESAAGSLNRVFKSICPSAFLPYDYLPLGILFYEPQQSQDNNCESYSDSGTGKSSDDIDSTMQPWIAGFVEWMGDSKAAELLLQHQQLEQNSTEFTTNKKCTHNKEEEQQPEQQQQQPQPEQQQQLLQSSVHDKTSSACLLIKDENHNLIEWLAYHYFTMNLRYLVVVVDETSVTSPKEILDRWRANMTIVEWGDKDIAAGSRGILKSITPLPEIDSPQKAVSRHRFRQNYFYRQCSIHMHKHNRTWTTYHDVDEFFTVNPLVYRRRQEQQQQESSVVSSSSQGQLSQTITDSEVAKQIMRQPGGILDLIYQYRYTNFTDTTDSNEKAFWYEHFQQGPCVTIGRDPISAYESPDEEVNQEVPLSFVQQHSNNGSRYFNTLRWRYSTCFRGAGKCSNTETLSKSLVDVSLLTDEHFKDGKRLVHRVFNVCPLSVHPYNRLPIGIAHYIGSWEVYSRRQDYRRSRDVWEKRSLPENTGTGEKFLNDHARPWLAGFVKWVGEEEAFRLLNDVGVLSLFPSSSSPVSTPMNKVNQTITTANE